MLSFPYWVESQPVQTIEQVLKAGGFDTLTYLQKRICIEVDRAIYNWRVKQKAGK